MNEDKKEALMGMYKSGIRASYFAHMSDPNMLKKSKLQISSMN